jgi:tartrate-resistant acid phosphatase type 5
VSAPHAIPARSRANGAKSLVFLLTTWFAFVGCRKVNEPRPTVATPAAATAGSAPTLPLPARDVTALGAELPEQPVRTPHALHLIAFGDSGIGTPDQFAVAARMVDVCRQRGCDFALHTGDIFYPRGVQTVDDPQFRTQFEEPYGPLGIPVYLSLGNHDHYGNAAADVEYTRKSPSHAWVLPSRYYTFQAAGVRFLALDTSMPDDEQARWALGVLQRSRLAGERFVIAYGHHPRQSYGAHGMADAVDPTLAHWLDRVLCWRVDVFIAGHDHDLQVLKPRCGVRQLVTGAAAQLRPVNQGPLTDFAGSELGFLYAGVDAQGFHGDILGTTGPGTAGGKVAVRSHVEVPYRSAAGCGSDGLCDATCPRDPDCKPGTCAKDGRCDLTCMDDLDCAGLGACPCDKNPVACDVRTPGSRDACGCDPACQRGLAPCKVDNACDPGCPPGADLDCAP